MRTAKRGGGTFGICHNLACVRFLILKRIPLGSSLSLSILSFMNYLKSVDDWNQRDYILLNYENSLAIIYFQ
jgi:hypothetical protein